MWSACCLARRHPEAVGVGDGQPMPADSEGEDRVGSGVDHPKPQPAARSAAVADWCCGQGAVHQVVGVVDAARVAKRGGAGAARLGRGRRPGRGEASQDVVGGAAGPVDPVVEDHDPLVVVVAGLGRVGNGQRGVQAAVELDTDMGEVEVGARTLRDELVQVAGAGGDRVLGHARHAVDAVGQREPVPVDAGVGWQLVVQGDPQQVSHPGVQAGSGHDIAVGPGVDQQPTQIDGGRGCPQRLLHHSATGCGGEPGRGRVLPCWRRGRAVRPGERAGRDAAAQQPRPSDREAAADQAAT